MRRIALVNQKGGVGKTTTAVNLGAALARTGRRVVLVDLDPQGNLSTHLSVEVERGAPSSYGVLTGSFTMAQAIVPTRTPGLSVVPTNVDLAGAELEMASEMGRELILREAVDEWEEKVRAATGGAPAEYLIFDCPPSLGLLSINALVAAREVFIALQTEFLALQGMTRLLDVIGLLQRRLNPTLAVTGIVPCLYDSRLRLAREVLGELRRYFPEQCFRRAIGTNVKLAEAPSYGQSVFEYAPESSGARDYEQLAEEVLEQERHGRATTATANAAATADAAADATGASDAAVDSAVLETSPLADVLVPRPDHTAVPASDKSEEQPTPIHHERGEPTSRDTLPADVAEVSDGSADTTQHDADDSTATDHGARGLTADAERFEPHDLAELPELPDDAIEVEPGRGRSSA